LPAATVALGVFTAKEKSDRRTARLTEAEWSPQHVPTTRKFRLLVCTAARLPTVSTLPCVGSIAAELNEHVAGDWSAQLRLTLEVKQLGFESAMVKVAELAPLTTVKNWAFACKRQGGVACAVIGRMD